MKKRALIILADGFEDIEAVTPVDILRRINVEVTVAGLSEGIVKGARGIAIKVDRALSDTDNSCDVVILPGGMPGAENLASSSKVKKIVLEMFEKGKLIAAICASPALVLAPLGILSGKKATCFTGMEENFPVSVKFSKDPVVQDGNIITSRGPATAFAFSLKIAENLVGKDMAEMVAKQTLYLA